MSYLASANYICYLNKNNLRKKGTY
jgi:hypothetical protein